LVLEAIVTVAMEVAAIIAGKYRVDRVLGRGSMSVVMGATHLQLHRPVAIKFLLPDLLGQRPFAQRFLREAQAAARLRSEHVAHVIDVGALDNGAPYMVMEYLDGADLSSVPRSQLTVGSIVDLILQACEALSEAHALGIVHRDIKPANFFVTRYADGAPLLKLLDFGISKICTTDERLTGPQTAMGTPAYMSPEQMYSSRDVDHRSDIWSLGVVLYELLQGAPPFWADTLSSLVLKVANDPLPRLTVRLPDDLDAIVYRCLEKDPARRFQNAAELAFALAKFARSEPQAAISVQRTRGILGAPDVTRMTRAPQVAPRARSSTGRSHTSGRTLPLRSNRRWPIAAALGGLAVVIPISFMTVSWRGGTDDRGASPAPACAPLVVSEPGHNGSAPATLRPSEHSPVAPPPLVASTPPAARLPTGPDAPSPPVARPPAPRARTAAPSEMARKLNPATNSSESRKSGTTPARPPALPDDAILAKRK
jgi:eukaryotic-like serine/threonine-protein kinase